MIWAALAAWIAFEPCGYRAAPYGFGEAPNLDRVWVRRDAVMAIVAPVPTAGGIACTFIQVGTKRWVVIGDAVSVFCQIAINAPECNGHDAPN